MSRRTVAESAFDATRHSYNPMPDADLPVVYVLNSNQIHAFSKRVRGYTPHPLENYKYHADLSLDA